MATALFIDENYINNITPLAANVDVNIIRPMIEATQDTTFERVLGTEFYTRLLTGIVDNDLNANERTIISNYIRPILAWYTVDKLIPFISVQLRNKGAMTASSDNSQPASKDDRDDLKATCKGLGDYYMESLNRYLCENYTLFPTYQNPDPDSLRQPYSQGYDCDLYLGDVDDVTVQDLRKYFK